jgi:hypothetical protein
MSTDEDMDTSQGGGPPDPIDFLRKLSADDSRLDLPLNLNGSDDNGDDENGDQKHDKKKRRIPQDPPARERPAVSTNLYLENGTRSPPALYRPTLYTEYKLTPHNR